MIKGVLDVMISMHYFSTRHRNAATKPPVERIIEGNRQEKQTFFFLWRYSPNWGLGLPP
jgi:hypothetical protein